MIKKILFLICVFMCIVMIVLLINAVVHEDATLIFIHACNLFTFTLLAAINYEGHR